MIPTAQEAKIPTAWFDEISQRLDTLRLSAHKYADEGEVLPPDNLYNVVKDTIQNLRQLADFPSLKTPDVWLGPGGEIGLTWDADDSSFDLLFSQKCLTARLTKGTEQRLVEHKDLPCVLTQFAA
jgi:hypothetical protein